MKLLSFAAVSDTSSNLLHTPALLCGVHLVDGFQNVAGDTGVIGQTCGMTYMIILTTYVLWLHH
jgi:hypothetical protein